MTYGPTIISHDPAITITHSEGRFQIFAIKESYSVKTWLIDTHTGQNWRLEYNEDTEKQEWVEIDRKDIKRASPQ